MLHRPIPTALAIAALLLGACGGTASPAPPSVAPSVAPSVGGSEAPSTAPTATPAVKEGGILIVAVPGDIVRTDPALASDNASLYVAQNVMEGLVKLAPGTSSKVVPSLATAWQVSPDGLQYTFTLRSGVKFHDGTEFNADAVKYNYDRWNGMPTQLQAASYYLGAVFGGYGPDSNIASVEVLSPTSVRITLNKPQSNFLVTQTLPCFAITSPAALKAGGADNTITDISKISGAQGGAGAMVGTGPFKFKEWVPNDHVTIVNNPDYWGPKAHLDEVTFKPVSDPTQILNGLLKGEFDLAQNVSPVDVPTLQSNKALQIVSRGESCDIAELGLNQVFPPLDNLKIRMAMAYAVNRQSYIDTFYAGLAVPADSWVPPATQYYKAENLPKYDPVMAKQLIKESGVPADKLVIDFYYPTAYAAAYEPDPKGEFEAITRDLEAVGFTIVPHSEAWVPSYLDDFRAGKFAMSIAGWTCDWATPDNYLKSGFFGYVNGLPKLKYGYRNDELQKTMADALAAPDEATAGSLWAKAQDLITADMPTIPLTDAMPPAAAQAYLEGFVGSGANNEYLSSVWLNK